ncbi:MAG: signal peptidase II [Firmicutes bacterium]|jgi:signal peptidase II|nr:signal peptidase II [Bacillota bacterium]
MAAQKSFIHLLAPLLIVLDQGIKLVINRYYLKADLPLLEPWFYFRPMFNRDYSWINSLFQLGIGKEMHIVFVLFVLVFVFCLYRYIVKNFPSTALINITFSMLFAGGICSLLDKVFWNGSLDYIYLRGFFTFDLKDVFINSALGLFLLMLAIDYQGLRTKLK